MQAREERRRQKIEVESLIQQRDMYKQLAAEREQKISQLGGTTRSAEEVKSELERRDEEKKKLERDLEMYVVSTCSLL